MLPSLTRRLFDPVVVDTLEQFQRDLNGLARRMYGPDTSWTLSNVEIWEDDQNIYVEAELPGVKPDDVDVTLEGGTLTIRGQKKESEETKQATWHVRQRRYGEFVQQFQLPATVDASKVSAAMKDGILRVTVEKKPEVKPKKIPVKGE